MNVLTSLAERSPLKGASSHRYSLDQQQCRMCVIPKYFYSPFTGIKLYQTVLYYITLYGRMTTGHLPARLANQASNPTCKAGQLCEELFESRALHHKDPLGVQPPPSPHCVAGDPGGKPGGTARGEAADECSIQVKHYCQSTLQQSIKTCILERMPSRWSHNL